MKSRKSAAVIPIVVGLALVAGCGSGSRKPDLGGACQLKPCACEKPGAVFWKADETVPLQWRADGSAYCPEGYTLRRTDKTEKKK